MSPKPKSLVSTGVQSHKMETEPDSGEGAHPLGNRALLFASQGLGRLCDMVPFSDLKSLRLVCSAYNTVVTWNPRFHSCQVTMKSDWVTKTKEFRLDLITKWKHLTLYYFPLHRNPFFKKYWPFASATIKTLNLALLHVDCMQLGKIINSASQVEEIKFNQIEFQHENNIRLGDHVAEEGAEEWVPTELNPVHNIYCGHEHFEGDVGPSTIKSITIYKIVSFPICILDLLEKRSAGVLEKFSFNSNTEGNTREMVHPAMVDFQGHLARICLGSPQTLKTLSWTRNQSNGNVIPTLMDKSVLELDMLTIALTPRENEWHGNWQIPQPDPTLAGLLNRQTLIRELNLAIVLNGEIQRTLEALLPSLLHLWKMKLQIDSIDWEVPRGISIFRECETLQDLTIVDDSCAWSRQHWINDQGIALDYLTALPMSIESLTCAHSFRQGQPIQDALANRTFRGLTKLVILDGTRIRDDIFQLIITRLRGLEELTVQCAFSLTDSGVTGLNEIACKFLHKCMKSHGFQFKEPEAHRRGHSLRELTHLRSLDLTKGSRLSEVSMFFAIRFPKLQNLVLNSCLKVSDSAIGWLGVHNPNLKTLEVKGCQSVTHRGLNRLINVCPKIQTIRADEIILSKRPTNRQAYIEHRRFSDIVYTKKPKKESQSQPMRFFRNPKIIKLLI